MRKVLILAVVCFFTLTGVSFAKGPGAMRGFKMPHDRWWHEPEIVETLDLTADEQAKLDELALERERELIDLRSNVQRQELELEAIFDKEDFDRSACLNQFDKLMDARTEVATKRFNFRVEVRELLGLDRYRLLRATLRDHQGHGMRGRSRGKGPVEEGTTGQ
jgi:Spy/CpxP family protein refolding chaperone